MILAPWVAAYGYPAALVGALFEGETVLVLAGLFAHRGVLDMPLLIVLGAIGGSVGDIAYFALGRRFGATLLERYPRFGPAAARVHALIERFPNLAVIGIRFLYGLRTVGPAVIGTSALGWPRFLLLNALGALAWSACWVGAGYVLGEAAQRLLGNVVRVERDLFIAAAVIALIATIILRLRRRDRNAQASTLSHLGAIRLLAHQDGMSGRHGVSARNRRRPWPRSGFAIKSTHSARAGRLACVVQCNNAVGPGLRRLCGGRVSSDRDRPLQFFNAGKHDMPLQRRTFIQRLSVIAAATAAGLSFGTPVLAADTIKVGVLHSLSGTMAISETVLKDVTLMAIEDINAKGGVLGKKLEPVVVDPASNWPLFAEKARQLLTQDKVAVVFGCWTSVSRKSVLPVFEELNGLLFYPVQYEGEELSKNVFYTGAAPNQQAIPAVEYLLSKEGGGAKRIVLLGTDYVYPRTTNKILRSFLHTKGIEDKDIMETYTPFGHSDYQTIVADIKKFAAGGKTAVVSTINGDSNVPFYKELGNAGLKATDVPVVAFSVGEEELRGVDTNPLKGHLAAWNYFMSIKNPVNAAWTKEWAAYAKKVKLPNADKPLTNDPMEAAWIGIHMWAQAVTKAKSTDTDKVIAAMAGQTFPAPDGFTIKMDENESPPVEAGIHRRSAG